MDLKAFQIALRIRTMEKSDECFIDSEESKLRHIFDHVFHQNCKEEDIFQSDKINFHLDLMQLLLFIC